MKVLWLCNLPPEPVAADMGRPAARGGGWLTGLLQTMEKQPGVSLMICFPLFGEQTPVRGKIGKTEYNGFPSPVSQLLRYRPALEEAFRQILQEFAPDVVHIFGTEYPHTLAMVNAFGRPDRTLIHIQGLCSVCAEHYLAGLPARVQRCWTVRDLLRWDNIEKQQKKFVKRGEYEREAIRKTNHFGVRTVWDSACVGQIHPGAARHHLGESLREPFYEGHWRLEGCESHRIFVSQWNYPIKGFHFLLKALPLILRQYPDTKVFAAGEDSLKDSSFRAKLRRSSYFQYLRQLLLSPGLLDHVFFVGGCDADQMREQFEKAHVFVSPSVLENSSNSIGEAMLTGTPVVASRTGGTESLLEHGKEGLLYQCDSAEMLAYSVCRIFGDDTLAQELSANARSRAQETHDREKNAREVLAVYEELCGLWGAAQKEEEK